MSSGTCRPDPGTAVEIPVLQSVCHGSEINYPVSPCTSLTGLATDIKVICTSDNNEKFKLHF